MISAEYGWSDDAILDLTLARTRQIRSVIWERQDEQAKQQITVQERATQAVMVAVFAAAGNKKGAEYATTWRMFDPPKPKELPKFSDVTTLLGGDQADVSWAEIERMAAEIRKESDGQLHSDVPGGR